MAYDPAVLCMTRPTSTALSILAYNLRSSRSPALDIIR